MLTSMRSFLVLISGVAGSGKSMLAKRLAPALDLPLISKDTIKEALADSLGPGDDAWSQQLGAASFEVLWALLRDVPQAVLETSTPNALGSGSRLSAGQCSRSTAPAQTTSSGIEFVIASNATGIRYTARRSTRR
jgi:2-phosphoglycerate kinase